MLININNRILVSGYSVLFLSRSSSIEHHKIEYFNYCKTINYIIVTTVDYDIFLG